MPNEPLPSEVKELPTFAANLVRRGKYGYQSYRALKRVVDVIVSAIALLLLSPIFLILTLSIAIADGFPVIFRQKRIGEDGREFSMLKFRSMVKNAEEVLKRDPELYRKFQENFKLENDPRILPIGQFIRKTSLDELPQLINVLRGSSKSAGRNIAKGWRVRDSVGLIKRCNLVFKPIPYDRDDEGDNQSCDKRETNVERWVWFVSLR
jgi:hypothetical protein